MRHTYPPIVFFGTEDFSLASLSALIAAGFPIAAVVTKPDSKKGRGQHLSFPKVKTFALQHDLPVWQPAKLADLHTSIQSLGSPMGVLVSFGKIIPQSLIDLFPYGIINVHPSLLPKYRGPSPIESAIFNGDTITGVSIMQLSAAMDAGPVYTQQRVTLAGDETQITLYTMLAETGAKLLVESLPRIINNSLAPAPQDSTEATYCHLLQKSHATLRPDTMSAIQAERKVRAHLAFPKTKYIFNNHSVIITKAHVSQTQKTPLDILCQDGIYLSIDELVAPSGRPMTAQAFLNGYLLST